MGRIERLFSASEEALAARRAAGERRSGRELADLDLYYRVQVRPGATAGETEDFVAALNAFSSVEIAYAEPPAMPAADITPPTPDFEDQQGYLQPAPLGIDARYAWTVPGGRGQGVRIVDVERAWRTNHEDLPALVHQGGAQTPAGWIEHGTAVLGVMVAPDNGYGMTGIVPEAQAGVESDASKATASAITDAAAAAGAGGIVLIELQRQGPETPDSPCDCAAFCDVIPMEYLQAEFDAIAQATANGTVVVEAGGNGATDLDDPVYQDAFDRTQRDSGAILVGASSSADRTPTCFTNHGSRIDVHAWGENVATLGYGDLFDVNDPNQYYTRAFGGTSSASPIVAGAVAALLGARRADPRSPGDLAPEEIRQILRDTGTPQVPTDPRQIGPLPNLRAALPRILGQLPTVAWRNTSTGANLLWIMGAQGVASSHPLLAVSDPQWSIVANRDLDGDGRTDLLWSHTNGGNYLWRMYGETLRSAGPLPGVPSGWRVGAVGDVNADAKADVVWRRDTGENYLWLMDGATVTGSFPLTSVDTTWSLVGTGDLDSNGTSDLFWRRNQGNYVWLMDGASVSLSTSTASADATWIAGGMGDFDGDGHADVFWHRPTASGSIETYIWFMQGASVRLAAPATTIPGAGWKPVGFGDLDRDGKADILWRKDNGQNYLWLMDGGQLRQALPLPSLSPEWTVASPD